MEFEMEIAVLLPEGVQKTYVEWEKTAIFALKEFGLEASKPRRTAESKAKA